VIGDAKTWFGVLEIVKGSYGRLLTVRAATKPLKRGGGMQRGFLIGPNGVGNGKKEERGVAVRGE